MNLNFLGLCFLLVLASCASSQKGAKNSFEVFCQSYTAIPDNHIETSDSQNKNNNIIRGISVIDTLRTLYLLVDKKGSFIVDSIFLDQKSYDTKVSPASPGEFIGKKRSNGDSLFVPKSIPGNWWKVELRKGGLEDNSKPKDGGISVKGHIGKSLVRMTIKNKIELEPFLPM